MYRIVIICLICVFMCTCARKEEKKLYTIGFVQMTEDPLLDEAQKGVIDSLKEQGFVEGKNLHIEYQNAQGEMSNIPLILRKFISNKVDMIITNTTPCMVAAAGNVKDIPVVFTVAFSPEQLKMKRPSNLTGIYDPFLMVDFVKLIKRALPGLKTAGLPYSPSEPNASLAAEHLKQELDRQGIELIEMPVYSSSDVLQATGTLANKKVGAMIVSADNTVYIAFGSVVKIADERKIPLFVTEPSQVKRGASAGVGVDFYQWGRESGEIAARVIKGEKPGDIPIQPVSKVVKILNLRAARAQGISFPPDLIKEADEVIQ
jgi:putative ABC transport system substrate-binding protein